MHLGGLSTEHDFDAILQANIVGSCNVYEAARRAGTRRIVFASSNHVTGFTGRTRCSPPPRCRGRTATTALESLRREPRAVLLGPLRPRDRESRASAPPSRAERPPHARHLAELRRPRAPRRRRAHAPVVGHTVMYGMSDNAVAWWDNSSAPRRLPAAGQLEPFRAAAEARQPSDRPARPGCGLPGRRLRAQRPLRVNSRAHTQDPKETTMTFRSCALAALLAHSRRRRAGHRVPLVRHPPRRLPDRAGRAPHERDAGQEQWRQAEHQGVRQVGARQREGHHRADQARRAGDDARERGADEQHLPGHHGADHALPVPQHRAHAQGCWTAPSARDPEGLRGPGLRRPGLLRQRRALDLLGEEAGQDAGRREGPEGARAAERPVGLAAAGDGRQRHAHAPARSTLRSRPACRTPPRTTGLPTRASATSRWPSTTTTRPSTRWRPRSCCSARRSGTAQPESRSRSSARRRAPRCMQRKLWDEREQKLAVVSSRARRSSRSTGQFQAAMKPVYDKFLERSEAAGHGPAVHRRSDATGHVLALSARRPRAADPPPAPIADRVGGPGAADRRRCSTGDRPLRVQRPRPPGPRAARCCWCSYVTMLGMAVGVRRRPHRAGIAAGARARVAAPEDGGC